MIFVVFLSFIRYIVDICSICIFRRQPSPWRSLVRGEPHLDANAPLIFVVFVSFIRYIVDIISILIFCTLWNKYSCVTKEKIIGGKKETKNICLLCLECTSWSERVVASRGLPRATRVVTAKHAALPSSLHSKGPRPMSGFFFLLTAATLC